MAQRTGAERFLAPLAKAASARVLLALAVAALLLPGCGGEDSSSEQTGTATGAKAAAQQGDGAPASAQARSKAADPAKAGGGAAGPGTPAGKAPTGQGQKQGPSIAPPEGPPEQAPTPSQIASATIADMSLKSPAILAGSPGRLPATYTCDGEDSWPEFNWGGVPAGSAELIFYAMSVQPVEGKLFIDWAVAGLDPSLTGIEAGKLPKGAIVGTNSFGKRGYSICPAAEGEIYMFAVYALPRALAPPKGFDARELRKEILDVSGNVGLLPAVYSRG